MGELVPRARFAEGQGDDAVYSTHREDEEEKDTDCELFRHPNET